MAKRTFISNEDFKEIVEVQKQEDFIVKNWVEIPVEVVYEITSIEAKFSVTYGDCWILHIANEKGESLGSKSYDYSYTR